MMVTIYDGGRLSVYEGICAVMEMPNGALGFAIPGSAEPFIIPAGKWSSWHLSSPEGPRIAEKPVSP